MSENEYVYINNLGDKVTIYAYTKEGADDALKEYVKNIEDWDFVKW